MPIRLSTALRSVMADAMASNMGSSTMSVYTGTQPATPATAASGTKLVDIAVASWNAAVSGAAALNTTTPNNGVAVASGMAGWARLIVGTNIIDGTVGTTGTDFTINTAAIVNGATVTLTACTITQPAS